MNYLLDTHVFLWAITQDERMSAKHREIYLDGASQLWLSVASVWEILIKAGTGKLVLPLPAAGFIRKQMDLNRIKLLPVRMAHLAALEELPQLHRDPFDRMLVAQGSAEGMVILSDDVLVRRYSGQVV